MKPETSFVVFLSSNDLPRCHVKHLITNRRKFTLRFTDTLLSEAERNVACVLQLSLHKYFAVVLKLNSVAGGF
jgi:hypothetical protein